MSLSWKFDAKTRKVTRRSIVVADVSQLPNGLYRWDGMGMYRSGFKTLDQVVEDVIYFHRYPQKRVNKMTFKSGRTISW